MLEERILSTMWTSHSFVLDTFPKNKKARRGLARLDPFNLFLAGFEPSYFVPRRAQTAVIGTYAQQVVTRV